MSFNAMWGIVMVVFFCWAIVHGAKVSKETAEEREKAIAREKVAAERSKALAKSAAIQGAKLVGKALFTMLKK